jgi:hypothetical protein
MSFYLTKKKKKLKKARSNGALIHVNEKVQWSLFFPHSAVPLVAFKKRLKKRQKLNLLLFHQTKENLDDT